MATLTLFLLILALAFALAELAVSHLRSLVGWGVLCLALAFLLPKIL